MTKLICGFLLFGFVGSAVNMKLAVVFGWIFVVVLFLNVFVNTVLLLYETVLRIRIYCKNRKLRKQIKNQEVLPEAKKDEGDENQKNANQYELSAIPDERSVALPEPEMEDMDHLSIMK